MPKFCKFCNHGQGPQALNNLKFEDNYIAELCNKYKRFMGFKTIDIVHHKLDRYGRIVETNIKENQRIFDDALYTTMIIGKYFE